MYSSSSWVEEGWVGLPGPGNGRCCELSGQRGYRPSSTTQFQSPSHFATRGPITIQLCGPATYYLPARWYLLPMTPLPLPKLQHHYKPPCKPLTTWPSHRPCYPLLIPPTTLSSIHPSTIFLNHTTTPSTNGRPETQQLPPGGSAGTKFRASPLFCQHKRLNLGGHPLRHS